MRLPSSLTTTLFTELADVAIVKRRWKLFATHALRTPATPTFGATAGVAAGVTGAAGGGGMRCQSGLMSLTALFVTCVGDVPSAFMNQISSSQFVGTTSDVKHCSAGNRPLLSRLLKNAILVPSGDHAGF